jgi:hypothetical protein
LRQLVNQNSFVLIAIVLVGAALFVVRRRLPRLRWIGLPVLVVVLVAAALTLRTGESDVASGTELDRVLAKGKPVALEFYSNF